jgi:hypothetical protein
MTMQTDTMTEMFPIPAEAKRLERLLGDRICEGTLTMEGNSMPVTGSWRGQVAAAGWGVAAHFDGHIEGMGSYVEDHLFGYDQETGLTHFYALTNTGNVHDHAGRWTGPDSLELVYEGAQGGKPFREVVAIATEGDAVHVVATEYLDGQQSAVFDARFRK